jgi:hypothetical protein
MSQRLPLFADAVRVVDIRERDLQRIAWSYSRRQLLEQCAQRYFYEHFGATARRNDSVAQELRFLKTLQNRYERAGAILHHVIATWFRKAQQGDPWTVDRLERWAQDIYRRDVVYSKSYHTDQAVQSATASAPEQWPPTLLREFYYGDPDAAAVCADVEQRLSRAVRSFALSSTFGWIRDRGARQDALVETRVRIQGLPCKAEGQVDLAFTDDGAITIVDWKLGLSDGTGDDSLQLAVYGLWAEQRWPGAGSIHIYKAHLGDDTLVTWECTEARRLAARARIVQDAERMATLHEYGQDGVVEAFTPCAQRRVCAHCCYLRACPDGRACLGDRN